MIEKLQITSVRLSKKLLADIDAISAQSGKTRGTLIRQALEAYAVDHDKKTPDLHRMATTGEFNQIALDVLIKLHSPEKYDAIIEQLKLRMTEYHASA
jgi:metal-responsive CopG/Arc/MetJ family transcriptional regulator